MQIPYRKITKPWIVDLLVFHKPLTATLIAVVMQNQLLGRCNSLCMHSYRVKNLIR